MATLQQNLQRPFYIKHLLERLRYGKAASAMRAEAAEVIEHLQKELANREARVTELVKALDDAHGTPCEQIRHQQRVEELEAERESMRETIRMYGMQSTQELKAERDEAIKHAEAMAESISAYQHRSVAQVIALDNFRAWRARK